MKQTLIALVSVFAIGVAALVVVYVNTTDAALQQRVLDVLLKLIELVIGAIVGGVVGASVGFMAGKGLLKTS